MTYDAPTLYPLMRFRDAPAAIEFLKEAFGFRELQVIANEDGTIAHAELSYGPSILMLGSDREDPVMGSRAGQGWIYVAVRRTPMATARGLVPRARRFPPSLSTPTTARATTPHTISRATSGTSGPTVLASRQRRRLRRQPQIECRSLTQEQPTARRAGRPPRLSRAAVVAAARAIVERNGIDALTMRQVAVELGSSPMAIYRHVRDKDQLLVLLLDQLAAEVPRPRFPREPRRRLQKACRTMRDGLAQYPWVVDILAQGDLIAPADPVAGRGDRCRIRGLRVVAKPTRPTATERCGSSPSGS